MKRLLEMYYDLKESNTTSDFPKLLANVMFKILIDRFKGVNSPWKQYTLQSDMNDFKPHPRVLLGEAPDLLEVDEDGPYTDSGLDDYNYNITLKTFGRTFTVSRQAIINDDLNALRQQPARFGRAAGRTLAKRVVSMLEASGNSYDGSELFSIAHGNQGNTALTNDAAGIAAVSTGMTAIETATDPSTGEKMGLTAKFIMTGSTLADTAMRIVNGTAFVPVSTSGGTTEVGKVRRLTPIVEPFLASTTSWYIFADPADAHAVEVGFLKGKQTPDLLVKGATAFYVAGGEDEWGYEFDELFFKARYDFATQRAMYQAAYRGKL